MTTLPRAPLPLDATREPDAMRKHLIGQLPSEASEKRQLVNNRQAEVISGTLGEEYDVGLFLLGLAEAR